MRVILDMTVIFRSVQEVKTPASVTHGYTIRTVRMALARTVGK
jgi:hypothetical protein